MGLDYKFICEVNFSYSKIKFENNYLQIEFEDEIIFAWFIYASCYYNSRNENALWYYPNYFLK